MLKNGLVGTILNFTLLLILVVLYFYASQGYKNAKDYTNRLPDIDTKITCNNFTSQKDAQAFFAVYGNNGLDNDNDGIVCENLH